MATKIFADRVFLTMNGFELLNVKSAGLKMNMNLSRVETMTRNYKTAGYKHGNRSYQLTLGLDIESKKAQIDLALADPAADINCVFECGGERYIATGLAQADANIDGSVGDASKSINLEALDCVNENGVSVNVDISL